MALRHVDPTRRPGVFARAYAALAVTRLARFISRHVSWKLDPVLLRATRGRIASTLMFPSAVLETRGAKSGAWRRNAIIYFHDGERVIVAASNAGGRTAPPGITTYGYRTLSSVGIAMRGRPWSRIGGRARTGCWRLADNVFPAFGRYRTDAAKVNRVIPMVQLMRQWRARIGADRCALAIACAGGGVDANARLVAVEDELRTMIDGRAGTWGVYALISTQARPWRSS